MSARGVLGTAILAALRENDAIRDAAASVFDAPPVRAIAPYLVIEEPVLTEWGSKDRAGREGRIGVRIIDMAERPVTARALSAAADAALEAMAPALGEGWRIVTLNAVRSRIVRERAGWTGLNEYRVRMLRDH